MAWLKPCPFEGGVFQQLLTALVSEADLTQGFALGWDVAAPLALSKGKNNSNDKYGGFSTALRSGRNDGLW